MNDTNALLVCTFWPTLRFGTTITPRPGSYEQLSAEKIAPYTFTFEDIGVKVALGAGAIGRPRRLPTKNGWGPDAGCCARNAPAAIQMASVAAARRMCRVMGQ